MEIKGKTVLITGGAKRLGAFLSMELSKLGANLIIHYNSSEKEAKKLKEECEKNGSDVKLVKANFLNSISKLTKLVKETDILICNASDFRKIEPEKLNEKEILRGIKTEFLSHFILIKNLWIKSKKKNSLSKVIAISDATAFRMNFIPYHLGKKLLEYTTQEMAKMFAPYLTINCLALGVILTPEGKDENYIKKLSEKVPMKREGKMEEILSALKFIIENDYITGQLIKISGGM